MYRHCSVLFWSTANCMWVNTVPRQERQPDRRLSLRVFSLWGILWLCDSISWVFLQINPSCLNMKVTRKPETNQKEAQPRLGSPLKNSCLLSIADNPEAERISMQPPLDASWLPAAHWKQPHPGAAHQGFPAAPMKPQADRRGRFLLLVPATKITSLRPCQLSRRKGLGAWNGFCFLFFLFAE